MKELYYLESVAAGVEYTKEVVAKNPNLRELLQKHGVDFEKFKTSCNPFDFDFFFFDSGKNKYSALLTVGNQILYHCKVVNHSGPVKLAKVKSVENFPGIDKDYCFVFFEVQHEFAENISGSDIFNYKYFIKNKNLLSIGKPKASSPVLLFEPQISKSIKDPFDFLKEPQNSIKKNQRKNFVVVENKIDELKNKFSNYDLVHVCDSAYVLKGLYIVFDKTLYPYHVAFNSNDDILSLYRTFKLNGENFKANTNLYKDVQAIYEKYAFDFKKLKEFCSIKYYSAQVKRFAELADKIYTELQKKGCYIEQTGANPNLFELINSNLPEFFQFSTDRQKFFNICRPAYFVPFSTLDGLENGFEMPSSLKFKWKQESNLKHLVIKKYAVVNGSVCNEIVYDSSKKKFFLKDFHGKFTLEEPIKPNELTVLDVNTRFKIDKNWDNMKKAGNEKDVVEENEEEVLEDEVEEVSDELLKVRNFGNVIFYGVPGCGKSRTVKDLLNEDKNEDFIERVLFYPEFSYSDFVGQKLPNVVNGKINYDFVPGPFTKILKRATEDKDPSHFYYLVIEEINRGNAPEIFGDIFQLLDRTEDGESEYPITNENIQNYLGTTDKVKIPANLILIATMNTCDQNVFALDTAFKRRWHMTRVKNPLDDFMKSPATCNRGLTKIGIDGNIYWGTFASAVNEFIVQEENLEDKQLGAYFVSGNDLQDKRAFAEKVLMYLWNDVFRFNRHKIFREEFGTLDAVIDGFCQHEANVFVPDLAQKIQEYQNRIFKSQEEISVDEEN